LSIVKRKNKKKCDFPRKKAIFLKKRPFSVEVWRVFNGLSSCEKIGSLFDIFAFFRGCREKSRRMRKRGLFEAASRRRKHAPSRLRFQGANPVELSSHKVELRRKLFILSVRKLDLN